MTRVSQLEAARWRTELELPPPEQQLLAQPDAPRTEGSTAPTGTGRVIGPGLLDVPFSALAARAQRAFNADRSKLEALTHELIVAAEERLDADGVTYSHTQTTDGYFALKIEPNRNGHLLTDPAYDLEKKLGGFRFLYSPGKLMARGSNGDHWRHTRELCLGHQSIQDMLLDPVTVHEMEHAVLSRAEEKGIPQLFTGSFQANPGFLLPSDDYGIGGYTDYLSIQEVSAYAEQCFVHANRIRAVDFSPNYADEVAQLKEMASWGTAISERVGNLSGLLVQLLSDKLPVHAKLEDYDVIHGADGEVLDTTDDQLAAHLRVERFPLTIQPFGTDEPQPVGDPRVFVQVRGLPFSSSIPLPQAAADVEDRDFVAVRDAMTDHFTRLKAACRDLEPAFEAVWRETQRLEGTRPIEKRHLDELVNLVLALREQTKAIAQTYRNTFDPPPA